MSVFLVVTILVALVMSILLALTYSSFDKLYRTLRGESVELKIHHIVIWGVMPQFTFLVGALALTRFIWKPAVTKITNTRGVIKFAAFMNKRVKKAEIIKKRGC